MDKPVVPARDYVSIYRAALLKARLDGAESEVETAVKAAVNAALEDAETQCVELGHRKRIRGLMYVANEAVDMEFMEAKYQELK